ncbi:MAG: phospholipase [Allomuricauda sp.]|nr:MAG: phospholipase [Allomuricauda sp.]
MRYFCLTLFLCLTIFSLAQEKTDYQKLYFEQDGVTMPYRLMLPDGYRATADYPLVVVLHGSGERGNDNEAQLVHGSYLFEKEEIRKKYPAIVVFPQCNSNSSWVNIGVSGDMDNREFVFFENPKPTTDMVLLEGLIKYLTKKYAVDKKRMYVGGLSMGGFGTFELVRRNPKLFAAAFPICGGANPITAKKMKHLDWWVFHGEADKVVPPRYSTQMVDAMKKDGLSVKYSLYPGVGHNSWDNAFAEPELLPWLFSKSK